jgi:hypothetical protein
MRALEVKDLIGKTIREANTDAVNVVRLVFTDGTSLEIETDVAVSTPHGNIHGFFVSEEG